MSVNPAAVVVLFGSAVLTDGSIDLTARDLDVAFAGCSEGEARSIVQARLGSEAPALDLHEFELRWTDYAYSEASQRMVPHRREMVIPAVDETDAHIMIHCYMTDVVVRREIPRESVARTIRLAVRHGGNAERMTAGVFGRLMLSLLDFGDYVPDGRDALRGALAQCRRQGLSLRQLRRGDRTLFSGAVADWLERLADAGTADAVTDSGLAHITAGSSLSSADAYVDIRPDEDGVYALVGPTHRAVCGWSRGRLDAPESQPAGDRIERGF